MSGNFGKTKPTPVVLEHAQRAVMDALPSPRIASVPLAEACGHVVASEIKSDVDMPPFDRSAMDGYAVRARDTQPPPRPLTLVGEVAAGDPPGQSLGEHEAMRIMTGAPIPSGADAVQMVERTRLTVEGTVEILDALTPGQNVARRGEDLRTDMTVLALGTYLGPAEIGLLAAVGRTTIPIFAAPRVAVIATGNELVAATERPGPGCIRNSNGPALAAMARLERCSVTDLGIVRDEDDALRASIALGLEHDVLLLSGGVSMGAHDRVDALLRDAGVELLVESVAIKPGKPTVFGVKRDRGTLVFGLPGNPLSCLVAFTLLARPAIRRLRRIAKPFPARVRATVLGAVKGDRHRRTFVRGRLRAEGDGHAFEPLALHGSADLPAYTRGNALLEIPEGRHRVESGESAWVIYDEVYLER